ncbi:MAG: DNA translocase FtsK 4TM domain-containing protein [Gammaproteobacteria bacterium]|nr:DNA translocase FtsK 4TM domain-containing protein [Gammaproteobacteria bacterium]MCW8839623.1 DNA translocase FtsK 4TM domain-containing protein [Gammaproteobacteria bacterium]MCW8928530.1 DNA translocase FtsK 4TM domain-containing protein [Gammaproteobacteria bacterium]MCW8957641.1 DNA translocase FtsK 4TM domain-containing protein [Gammaproteobacteria bacterium]MCW8973581.1 DNA translocase FtsK 4TM domain-containing protein [Gammaproteobacteria bacterium]
MAQASQKKGEGVAIASHLHRGLREGALILVGTLALYLLISLLSYSVEDPGWSHSGSTEQVRNMGGRAGAWFSDIFLYLFGLMAYLFPFMVAYGAWMLYREERGEEDGSYAVNITLRAIGFVLTLAAGAGIAYLHFHGGASLPLDSGGILGDVVGKRLVDAFSFLGATLFLLALFLTGVTLFTGLSWFWLMDAVGAAALNLVDWFYGKWLELRDRIVSRKARQQREKTFTAETKREQKRQPPKIQPVISTPKPPSAREQKEKQVPLFAPEPDSSLPPLSLLDSPSAPKHPVSTESLEAMSRLVEMKLRDFGVEVEVEAVHPGPVITRFELQPAPGVKVSQIANLSKDLARSLSTTSVRVVEVIPGKTTVGLEIPNEHREIVHFSETIRSREYESSKSPLTLALGKDIGGKPTVADLAKMPHLLVAGTTGSGKSVAVNAMILSILYNATPKEVRFIMVDPKMLELSIYEGIPHLLAPVVTDMKDASNALRWCVAEMERRYKLMASMGVRNIAGFNKKVREAIEAKQPIKDPTWQPLVPDDPELEAQRPDLEPLPFIVVVVDELADMMMVVGKKVEELIARLAQKARAAGIHLILATQRPSVDVLTGLIKANIPTRIAFQVSSRIDSRTILDQMGAESLLGHGDMLYLPPGHGVPIRVHGAFVDDHEVHNVVEDLKKRGQPNYLDEIINGMEESSGPLFPGDVDGASDDADPLYDEAVKIVTESRRASVSGIQRRLKIGYNRAARMVEEMEATGVVSSLQPNGSREVLAPPPPKD